MEGVLVMYLVSICATHYRWQLRTWQKNQGHFKSLLDFLIDAADKDLQQHLEICGQNASYISKTTQNELLDSIKEYIDYTMYRRANNWWN